MNGELPQPLSEMADDQGRANHHQPHYHHHRYHHHQTSNIKDGQITIKYISNVINNQHYDRHQCNAIEYLSSLSSLYA